MVLIYRDENGDHRVEGELPEPRTAVKKPIPVTVYEMPVAFRVETIEGTMDGKPGDLLMVGVRGEMYPCDRDIFFESYDFVD